MYNTCFTSAPLPTGFDAQPNSWMDVETSRNASAQSSLTTDVNPSTSSERNSRSSRGRSAGWNQDFLAMLETHRFVSKTHLTSHKNLVENGYPMFINGLVTIAETKYTKGKKMWLGDEEQMRTCCRCSTVFHLLSSRHDIRTRCRFHPRAARKAHPGAARVHACCGSEIGSDGCRITSMHVFDQQLIRELGDFVKAEAPRGRKDYRSHQIYAIDCEMVYTMAGPSLARLTVVDWHGNPVLDCTVRPAAELIDTNKDFSGLTVDDLIAATDSFESCRRKFLSLINQKTILVGHSLESDLKALRLVHHNCVDTAILFKSGDYKIGLKILAERHLGIQCQQGDGHDSEEDARVSLKLLKYCINNYYMYA